MFENYNPHPWKSQDPDWGNPDRKGMLLSDQIHRFCTLQPQGLLISEGYDESKLRPAAFTLTVDRWRRLLRQQRRAQAAQ